MKNVVDLLLHGAQSCIGGLALPSLGDASSLTTKALERAF